MSPHSDSLQMYDKGKLLLESMNDTITEIKCDVKNQWGDPTGRNYSPSQLEIKEVNNFNVAPSVTYFYTTPYYNRISESKRNVFGQRFS